MSNNEISDAAIKKAQQVALKHGFRTGDLVSHPNSEKTYRIIEIVGETAAVVFNSDSSAESEETRREFPISELYDPNTARQISRRMLAERNAARAKG